MKSIDRERLKDIFHSALELPADERISLVYSTCGNDIELLDEVLSLLKANDETVNLIENNAIDVASEIGQNVRDQTDKRFGNYRIVREIGHGGMGTVFLAERDDGEFDQQVALKIVRQSIADSRIVEKFRRERQILADLHHPNIAVLLDGGISDLGEPFIAMEYVEGLSLIEYALENDLSVEEKLKLFLKVCAAAAYAHRNLVVHRDIKPSNIFVTSSGEPKLLDFGLAKAFEDDVSQTQTAVRAFTPAYASPEQVNYSTITTASDVYSLGVVLYELLTGAKPLSIENKSYDEIIHTINTSQPLPPSTVTEAEGNRVPLTHLRGDLDNIVLMTLRKEPERRYGSVEDLAADIERHLVGRPVSARPNTFGYRADRFIRRNKIAVAAAVLITISLLTGLIFSLWQANVARRERDRAEKRFQDVRKLSNSLLFEITPRIENLMGATEARETVVTRALEYLDSLAAESADDLGLQAELAAAYEKVGDLQGNPNRPNLSNFAGAIESYDKAHAIRERLATTRENRRLIAKNLQISSLIRNRQNDIDGSISSLTASIGIYNELREAAPSNLDLAIDGISARLEYAQIHSQNNQYAEAVPIFRSVLTDLGSLDASSPETQKLLTRAYFSLGNALSWDGRQQEAEAEIARATNLVSTLSNRLPNDPEILTLVWQTYQFASSVFEDSEPARSLMYSEKSLKAAETAVASDKADLQARYNLARAQSRIGLMSGKLNDDAAARRWLSRAESTFSELIVAEPRNTIYQRDLAKLYVRMGDTSEKRSDLWDALLKYQNSAVIFDKLSQLDAKNTLARRDLAQSLKSVGLIALKLGQEQNGRLSLDRALLILDELRSQNALGKFDEKMIAEIEAALTPH